MTRYRSIVGLLLAVVATVLVSCSSAPTAKLPTTYTPDQLETIQQYAAGVQGLRDRIPELESYIRDQDWVNIQSLLHGPYGELRSRMGRLSNTLLPQDKAKAIDLSKDLFKHLELLDESTLVRNQIAAGREFRLVLDDFDAFLALVPEA